MKNILFFVFYCLFIVASSHEDSHQESLACNLSGSDNCFIYLPNNRDFNVQNFNFKYEWKDNKDFIDFIIMIELKDTANFNNKWLAIGFALEPIMRNATVAMCNNQESNKKIQSYLIGERYSHPTLLRESNPSLGLENGRIDTDSNRFTCSFSMRKSINDAPEYKDLENNSYYILAAYGDLSDNGLPLIHTNFGTSDASIMLATQKKS